LCILSHPDPRGCHHARVLLDFHSALRHQKYTFGSICTARPINTPGGEKFVVPDFWFESVVPVCVFSAHRLQMIKLYPITIEPNARDRSGIPSTAGSERGRAILERLKELSAAFGTKVEISDGMGLVRVPAG
jgi:hypothetical protein